MGLVENNSPQDLLRGAVEIIPKEFAHLLDKDPREKKEVPLDLLILKAIEKYPEITALELTKMFGRARRTINEYVCKLRGNHLVFVTKVTMKRKGWDMAHTTHSYSLTKKGVKRAKKIHIQGEKDGNSRKRY